MIKSFKRLLAFGLIVALVAAAFPHKPALAAESPALGLQVSPVTVELNGDPGKSYSFKITTLNVTSADLTIKPVVNDFTAKDESGTPKVILKGRAPLQTSLADWITLSDTGSITLPPKKFGSINVTVNIPKGAEPGGHYGVVRFTGGSGDPGDNAVALKASVGTLMLVRVSGHSNQKLEVSSFFTSRNGSRTAWFEKGPIGFTERLHNTGNVDVAPQGNLTITNMFGKVVGTIDVNKEGGKILPNSIRRYDQIYSNKGMFGRYTASFFLGYGTHGQVVSGSLSFWVIPYKQVFVFLILMALVVFLSIRGIKSYNKRIVKKALKKKE